MEAVNNVGCREKEQVFFKNQKNFAVHHVTSDMPPDELFNIEKLDFWRFEEGCGNQSLGKRFLRK